MHPFDAVARGRALMETGADVNELLMELRLDGINVIDCIIAVRELYGLSLDDAKRAVLASPAFADERARFEPHQDQPIKTSERPDRRRKGKRPRRAS